MDYSKSIERALFEAAAGIAEPAEREAFLDHTCQGDPELRGRLENLLALQDRAEDFFDVPPVKMPASVTRIAILEGEEGATAQQSAALAVSGACIGRYRLLQRMGEGGHGVVYRAEQLEPVRREVALKVIRLGMDTESVIARFELERQALAMMDHPNIARVLDAGTTSTGRPFFVMELVDGERITDFCQAGQLSIRERLDLFVRVCQEIQHARDVRVIHQRQCLPFHLEARDHRFRIHPEPDHLQRHAAYHRLLLLGFIDDPAAAGADPSDQPVAPDRRARFVFRRGSDVLAEFLLAHRHQGILREEIAMLARLDEKGGGLPGQI